MVGLCALSVVQILEQNLEQLLDVRYQHRAYLIQFRWVIELVRAYCARFRANPHRLGADIPRITH